MELYDDISEYIGFLAQKAVLYEVSASPKPGLVDRFNCGSHKDMNFFTFITSASAISYEFKSMAEVGIETNERDLGDLLPKIRPIGIKAEKKMFSATNGVNTHKGIIFSIGIICAAAGFLMRKRQCSKIEAEELCEVVKVMTKGISEKEFENIDKKEKLTNGEKLYKEYGFKGIRGEVESGFETVLQRGLPVIREYIDTKDKNDILVQTLLSLMTTSEDSNVVWRQDIETLKYVQDYSKRVLANGGIFTDSGEKEIVEMDRIFIEKNISPGGSADLLAVTVMLALIEGKNL
ncbi:triphosphoribosyl-dephospho-CoA synthase CitG [Clostridium sp. DL1XJH146]